MYQEVETSYTIPHILKRLGEFLGAERAYIFTVHDKSMSNTFEWCRAGIAPQLEKLQNLDSSLTDPWKAALTQGKCFVLYDIEKTHQTGDSALYEILKMQNIHSLAAAPMEQDGALIGWLGVDNPPMERLKNISTLLHTLCYFLMLALRRDADKQALIRMGYTDKLTGLSPAANAAPLLGITGRKAATLCKPASASQTMPCTRIKRLIITAAAHQTGIATRVMEVLRHSV